MMTMTMIDLYKTFVVLFPTMISWKEKKSRENLIQ